MGVAGHWRTQTKRQAGMAAANETKTAEQELRGLMGAYSDAHHALVVDLKQSLPSHTPSGQ